MNHYPKVAIVYLSYHSEQYISDAVSAFKKVTYPKDRMELVIVDNPHPKYGNSVRYIEEHVVPLSGGDLPHVTLLPQKENLGFAGGNNVGIKWAIDHGFDYVYFHNNDGFVSSDFLEPIVAVMEEDEQIGAAQSLILLYPDSELINTTGNCYHYLGLGYCGDFRLPKNDVSMPRVKEINYASGAGLLMRTDLLKQHGSWDESYFMYHEDIEYSYRLKSLGYKVVTVRDSVFFHKYVFGRNADKFYYIERNRIGFLLSFYKLPTLLLILPMFAVLELGILLFALSKGWLLAKLRAYIYWLSPVNWQLWLKKRRVIQSARTVSDRKLLHDAVGQIKFDDGSVNNPLLNNIGNPLMGLYWMLIKSLLFW